MPDLSVDPVRVLVTGGEGLVGSAVVAGLVAAGHEVTTLTLPDAVAHEGVRMVRGDARDPAAVARALDRVDAVAHLAAIPGPDHAAAVEVFGNNALATFTVLWTAAEHGVRRFVIASSVNATGLLLNPHHPLPPRYPVDESVPADLADPYSLSKQVDEHTLRTVCRRFGASGVALRLPLMVSSENREQLRSWMAGRPEKGAGDGWGWLDVRDAAEAFRLAITGRYEGAHVVHVAAGETFDDRPTEELLRRYAPDVPRQRAYPGHTAPIDTGRARALLGFVPRFADPPSGAVDDEEG
ncbi:NAD(P)-dependent oxidoreductase [Rugosimonospora acidiphila]|uniref:NAD(P)-dependent oxidoreductase n=1 Tax=Rugosimonospora acidiphila TaxID=556531 RepID=A0ABP9SC24_9ACTN